MLHERERVDPIARYVAREEVPREEKECRGGGESSRERGAPTVRGPHSTDNVTFFNPRFTLFAPPSAARKAQTVKVRLLSLYRPSHFATWKRKRDKDDVSLPQRRQRRRGEHCEGKSEDPQIVLRVRANFAVREEERIVKEEEKKRERKKEDRYVRCRECLGRPFQSSDNGARSVYTFWNSFHEP